MSLATAELPADPAALRAFALACQGELKAAQTAVQLKALEIEKLRFQIAKLRRMQFGRSSERITRQIEQLELQLEELETSEAEDVARAEANEPDAPDRIDQRGIAHEVSGPEILAVEHGTHVAIQNSVRALPSARTWRRGSAAIYSAGARRSGSKSYGCGRTRAKTANRSATRSAGP
jgi:hypothetical protein